MPSRPLPLLLGTFCLVLPSVVVLSSHTLSVIVPVVAVLAGAAAWREGRGIDWPDRALMLLLVMLVAWCALSGLWSFRNQPEPTLALRLGGLAAAGCLLYGLAARLTEEERARIGRWLCIGFACGLAFFLFERVTDSTLRFAISTPHEARSVLSLLNRGATGLALLVWPVTAILMRGPAGRLALILPAALLALLFFYESQAAILGTALGLAALLLGLASTRLQTLVIAACLLLGLLGAPLIAKAIFSPDAFERGWVEWAAQHRLYIWNYVADRILERPFLGWGLDSGHYLSEMGGVKPPEAEWPLPSHPHNGALQLWLELGPVGVLAMAGVVLVACRLAARLAGFERAAAGALLTAGFVIACLSYGIWQSQWIALLLSMGLVAQSTRAPAGDLPG